MQCARGKQTISNQTKKGNKTSYYGESLDYLCDKSSFWKKKKKVRLLTRQFFATRTGTTCTALRTMASLRDRE